MVQYQTKPGCIILTADGTHIPHSRWPVDNEYWKLSNPSDFLWGLREFALRGRGAPPWSSETRILKASRLLRGMFLYEKCTDIELCKFSQARGLPIAPFRDDIIASLEQADQEATLEGFTTEMPPELRVRIYGYYMADFSAKFTDSPFALPPPITRVNGIIRKESLPLFYDISKPMELVGHACPMKSTAFKNDIGCRLSLQRDTLINMPSHLLSNVRYLTIGSFVTARTPAHPHYSCPKEPRGGKWKVDFSPKAASVFTQVHCAKGMTRKDQEKKVGKRLQDLVDEVVKRGGQLNTEDLGRFLEALEL